MRTLRVLRLVTMAALAAASATVVAAQTPPSARPTATRAATTQAPTPTVDSAADTAADRASTAGGAEQAAATPQPQAAGKVTPPQAAPAASRQAEIEQEQAAKVPTLRPYVPNKGEKIFDRLDIILEGGGLRWHPYFNSAYSGGGFTLGMGYMHHVSAYNTIDARGSYTISGYKRAEVEFLAPHMFNRRAELSLLGGWREATQVGFYGLGPDTSVDDRTNYLFQQQYGSALFTIFPTRGFLMLRGGAEFTTWSQEPGQGGSPSVETVYTPEDLPGLDAEVTYLHTQGTVGLDWRTSPGYSRRGGFLGATLHDYNDRDKDFGFQMVEYEAIQHIPILREAWVLSFRGRLQHANEKDGQQIPFFMLPSVGGGSSLRGYSSWRFRDQNSLLLTAEWRIMVNRYLDTAFFYDAGMVAPRTEDFAVDKLKSNFGFGFRFHGPLSTPLRVELAKSREGLAIVFSSTAAF